MGESRLERGLRAGAWIALGVTVATLLAIGFLTRTPAIDAPGDEMQTLSTARVDGTMEEER